MIARRRLADLVASLDSFPDLSYFEALTCAAVLEFAEREVDVAVMEAGLGGRWDASNAVDPAVALLTNVGTDHQRWLGDSRTAIAAEKAAALRGRAAIVGAWDPEVEPVIRAAADPSTPLSLASEWATVRAEGSQLTADSPVPDPDREGERKGSRELSAVSRQVAARQRVSIRVGQVASAAMLPLAGAHQLDEPGARAGRGSPRSRGRPRPRAIRPGDPARHRGRLVAGAPAVVRTRRRGGCCWTVRTTARPPPRSPRALDEMGLSGKLHLLFSCLDDKPLDAMAALLRPRVAGVTVAPIRSPRARTLDDLAAAFPGCRRATSVAHALLDLQPGHPTLVTGSLRLVGEVLAGIGETDGRA